MESFVGKNGKIYRPSSMFAATPAAARMAQTLLSELGDDVPEGKHLSSSCGFGTHQPETA